MTSPPSLRATQEFFASRAPGWEERYPDDGPRYAQAVAEMNLAAGATALDLGCGTGRALPSLRSAVGATGRVVGLDATPEMLLEARRLGRETSAALLLGNAAVLPFAAGCAGGVFAGGLLPHLGDPASALAEFARVTRPGGVLAVFHPIGRRALAARHHSAPSDDDALAPVRLTRLLADSGWDLVRLEDSEVRYFALARRR